MRRKVAVSVREERSRRSLDMRQSVKFPEQDRDNGSGGLLTQLSVSIDEAPELKSDGIPPALRGKNQTLMKSFVRSIA